MPLDKTAASIPEKNNLHIQQDTQKHEDSLEERKLKALIDLKIQTAKQWNSFWGKQNKLNYCETEYRKNPSPEIEQTIFQLKEGIKKKLQLFEKHQPEKVIRDLKASLTPARNSMRP
jgi:hypothetical protein